MFDNIQNNNELKGERCLKQFIKIVMTILICVGIGVSVTYLFREIDMQSSQMSFNDDNQYGDWNSDGR